VDATVPPTYAATAGEVRAAAEAYCAALHRSDAAALEALFDPRAHLYGAEDGAVVDLPRDAWLARVAARAKPPPDSRPAYRVEMVDLSGPETAVARVSLAVGSRSFTDYLNWLKVDGSWRVIAKVYRVTDGPAA
jgi:4-oxalocrotonate tautomerase